MGVLFLARPRVLEPHLGDPFAESRQLGYPLQILPVRVAVDLEVGLQDVKLLLGERRPYPLGLVLVEAVGAATICATQKKIQQLN